MIRVVFGGDEFATFAERDGLLNTDIAAARFTDEYVKLVFLAGGFDYPEPLDLDVVRATMPSDAWPVLRTYTIRWIDHEAQEVAIDFVVHGEAGVAGPWALNAQPGDVLHLRGPNGAYAPDPAADWHLFVGDEAALPAIAGSLEALEPAARAVAFLEVEGPADEIELTTAADLELHWLHRGDHQPGFTSLLDDAVRAFNWLPGRVHAFVHGESNLLKTVRPYLLDDRQVPRSDASVSGYWRRGETEEGFRVWKSQQTAAAVIRPGAS